MNIKADLPFVIPPSPTIIQPEKPVESAQTVFSPDTALPIPSQLWIAGQLNVIGSIGGKSPLATSHVSDVVPPDHPADASPVFAAPDAEYQAMVAQDSLQKELSKIHESRIKARGSYARMQHDTLVKREHRPRSAVFLSPEREKLQATRTEVSVSIPRREIYAPASQELVRPKAPGVRLPPNTTAKQGEDADAPESAATQTSLPSAAEKYQVLLEKDATDRARRIALFGRSTAASHSGAIQQQPSAANRSIATSSKVATALVESKATGALSAKNEELPDQHKSEVQYDRDSVLEAGSHFTGQSSRKRRPHKDALIAVPQRGSFLQNAPGGRMSSVKPSVDSYVDYLARHPVSSHLAISPKEPSRPSSCFMSPTRSAYIPQAALRDTGELARSAYGRTEKLPERLVDHIPFELDARAIAEMTTTTLCTVRAKGNQDREDFGPIQPLVGTLGPHVHLAHTVLRRGPSATERRSGTYAPSGALGGPDNEETDWFISDENAAKLAIFGGSIQPAGVQSDGISVTEGPIAEDPFRQLSDATSDTRLPETGGEQNTIVLAKNLELLAGQDHSDISLTPGSMKSRTPMGSAHGGRPITSGRLPSGTGFSMTDLDGPSVSPVRSALEASEKRLTGSLHRAGGTTTSGPRNLLVRTAPGTPVRSFVKENMNFAEKTKFALPIKSQSSRASGNFRYKASAKARSPWRQWRVTQAVSAADSATKVTIVEEPKDTAKKQSSQKIDSYMFRMRQQEEKAKWAQSGRLRRQKRGIELSDDRGNERTTAPLDAKLTKRIYNSYADPKSTRMDILKENEALANGERSINRTMIATLRHKHVSLGEADYTETRKAMAPKVGRASTASTHKAASTSGWSIDSESATSAKSSRARARRPQSAVRARDNLSREIDQFKQPRIPVPNLALSPARSLPPRTRNYVDLKPTESIFAKSSEALAEPSARHEGPSNKGKDMRGLFFTPNGIPVPRSLEGVISATLLDNIRTVPMHLLAAGDKPEQTIYTVGSQVRLSTRDSALKPEILSVNDIKHSAMSAVPNLRKARARSTPLRSQGMRFTIGREPEPSEPVYERSYDRRPNMQETIEVSNQMNHVYELTHKTNHYMSRIPVSGREVQTGRMAAQELTNIKVPTSSSLRMTQNTRSGSSLMRPALMTSYFDYQTQINPLESFAYTRPSITVPYISLTGQDSPVVSRQAAAGNSALFDPRHQGVARFSDKSHITDVYASKPGPVLDFSTQLMRTPNYPVTNDLTYKVSYKQVEKRASGSPSLAKQQPRFK